MRVVLGWVVAAVAAGAVGAAGVGVAAVVTQPSASDPVNTSKPFPLVVTKIVDGDTFDATANERNFRVRLLLVDTPEMVTGNGQPACLALEAKARLASLLPIGSTAMGEYDVDQIDPYGRDLLYVWATNEAFVNRELVAEGLAKVMYVAPNEKRRTEIEAAQASAAASASGLLSPAIGCTDAAKQKAAQQQAQAAEQAARERARQERIQLKLELKRQKEEARREQARNQALLDQRSPSSGGSSSGSNSGGSGYTGPRCYEPGGKVWHPC